MLGPVSQTIENLRGLISAAISEAVGEGLLPTPSSPLPDFLIERPSDPTLGDFASNAAMASAKAFGRPPRVIAQAIADKLNLSGTEFEKVEIAGPGFINFFVSGSWFSNIILRVLADKDSYGRTDYGCGKKVMVEFVSANPTGPMHMGNARGGAIGDSLAAAMDAAGYNVSREFLINDAGNQIEKFGMSLEARYLQQLNGEDSIEFPEGGYPGADITEHAKNYIAEFGDKLLNIPSDERRKALCSFALPLNKEKMKADLSLYRISFDCWFSESSLHDSGAVKRAVDTLSSRGFTYEKDGAVWYKNREVLTKNMLAAGKTQEQIDQLDLKDDVLIRANGFPTYFAADIAYHSNKLVDRGFDLAINIWGADHHGHVARLKGALDAVGVGGEKLDIVLMQLVRLTRDGKPVRMGKRIGNAITLSDLLDEVPVDAARFFFNMREPGSAFDFDLNLAVEQTSQNPVYYVQYAHARACSILKNLAAEGINLLPCSNEQLRLLSDPAERELIRALAVLPEEIIMAAKNYDPARLTRWLIDTAASFHRFYNACRVKTEDENLVQARLSLVAAFKISIANVLKMLKIDTPEIM